MADETTPIADLTVGAPGTPEIDAELAGGFEDYDPAAEGLLEPVGVDPATVRQLLEALTTGVHHVAGHDEIPEHWKARPDELDQASSALARIASRSPVMARALGGDNGDGLVLVLVGGQYVIRNVAAARAAEPKETDDEDSDREDAGGARDRMGGPAREDRGGPPASLRLGGAPDASTSG